jgi:hypothetical protein
MKIIMVAVAGIVAVLFSLWGIWYYSYIGNSKPHWDTGLDHVEWLPPSATDISYGKSGSIEVYEFSMTKDQFLDWVAEKKFGAASEIKRHIEVLRWYAIKMKRTEEDIKNRYASINNGLVINRKGAGGGGRLIVYDASNSRVYYEWTRQ